MSRFNTAPLLLLGLPVAFFTAFFVAPMMTVLISSLTSPTSGLTFAHYARILLDEYHWEILVTTTRLAVFTTVICLIVGYPLSYFLVNVVKNAALRRICIVMLVLPLFTSNIVRSFGWMVLLGRRGLLNDGLLGLGITEVPMRLLGTETGVLIGLVYIHLPFIVIAVANSLARIDESLGHAACDLGAGKWTIFGTITLPLSITGIVAGSLMVFALSMSAYVTPALLGSGQITMFSMLIFQQYSTVFDFNFGGALSITLLVLTLIIVSLSNRFGKERA
ncbi:ABC transporter permease [Rhizobium sp. 18055]|uniref:ABC transporter permease n=1 Tax=Rhizobium sp. 18055 TaxID=2681403 RepID=UPI0013591C98|nr:ABC transporter permease [Rhizobium sp. 18055]